MKERYWYKAKHSLKSKGWHKGSLEMKEDGLYLKDNNGVMVFINDKETICQNTGLNDKNGDLIWENDIVRLYENTYIVTWSEDDAMFVLEDVGVIEHFGNVESKWCEVVGNKFDNPELLESWL